MGIKRGPTMATYIMLIKSARLDGAKKAFKAMGAQMKEFYLVTGRYDIVVVLEAPDAEAVAKCALDLGSKGNVTTETLRAFTEDEYRKIIAALPDRALASK